MAFNFFFKIFSFFLFFSILYGEVGFHEPWGKDIDLISKESSQETEYSNILVKTFNAIIQFHQEVISPIDGPRSHFRPTSSKYMQLAIRRYGFFKGFLMGCDRLLRENDDPWVYQTITIDGTKYKYDPAREEKFSR